MDISNFLETFHKGRAHGTEHFCFVHRFYISYSFQDATLRIANQRHANVNFSFLWISNCNTHSQTTNVVFFCISSFYYCIIYTILQQLSQQNASQLCINFFVMYHLLIISTPDHTKSKYKYKSLQNIGFIYFKIFKDLLKIIILIFSLIHKTYQFFCCVSHL